MKQPERQAGHLNPYSAYVENSWTYHSTPSFVEEVRKCSAAQGPHSEVVPRAF